MNKQEKFISICFVFRGLLFDLSMQILTKRNGLKSKRACYTPTFLVYTANLLDENYNPLSLVLFLSLFVLLPSLSRRDTLPRRSRSVLGSVSKLQNCGGFFRSLGQQTNFRSMYINKRQFIVVERSVAKAVRGDLCFTATTCCYVILRGCMWRQPTWHCATMYAES